MEKIFEDKEFHGAVKFFKEVIFDRVVSFLLRVTPLNGAVITDDVDFLGEKQPVLEVYKSTHDWWASLRVFHKVVNPSSSKDIKGIESNAELRISSGAFARGVEAIRNRVYVNITGTGSYTDNGISGGSIPVATYNIFRLGNPDGEDQSTEVIPNAVGVYNEFSSETGVTSDVTNNYGFFSNMLYGAGVTVTNAYNFYSKFTKVPTNGWHFYGVGAYPSFFGGDVEIAGIINNPEINVALSDPPSQAEMVSGLGTASAGEGQWRVVKSSANTRYLIFSDGTNWWYNAFTVGA